MRRAGRTDNNHADVRRMLRDIGASVQDLHAVGSGCPDLLIGYRGSNILLEVKDGSLPPSKQKLTTDEGDWHAKWGGQVAIATSAEHAVDIVLRACGMIR